MPMTVTNAPGDGSFIASIQLPDTNGGNVLIGGSLNPNGVYNANTQEVTFTGSPLTAPVAPVSGTTFWLIEVNATTGALDVQSSSSGFPANTAGCFTIFQQQLTSVTTDDAENSTDVTPDT